ncbi:hypothetical protein EYC84_000655 [Monilinia fructicola]|uniref:Uncharacterized protein n=1 Tax=Monilinia fructicola TaxID=38448 RepID=A0A5M9JX27_MONFR|nr:hypothetical protein EYC84_000655 [Monilinia fructicola]
MVKPSNCLQESLFFSKSLFRLAQITSDGETMLSTTVEVNLIRSLDFLENLFCLVAFVCWENVIGFSGCDREWPFDGAEFILFDET